MDGRLHGGSSSGMLILKVDPWGCVLMEKKRRKSRIGGGGRKAGDNQAGSGLACKLREKER